MGSREKATAAESRKSRDASEFFNRPMVAVRRRVRRTRARLCALRRSAVNPSFVVRFESKRSPMWHLSGAKNALDHTSTTKI
jgi:hypothetical protein